MEREFVTAEQSLSAHGPIAFIVALGGCAAAWYWSGGLLAAFLSVVFLAAGVAIVSRARVHELWIEGSSLRENTGKQVVTVSLSSVDEIEHLVGLKVPPSVRISAEEGSVVVTVDKQTEPLRRAIGQRLRQANPGKMYGDVRAMRDLFM